MPFVRVLQMPKANQCRLTTFMNVTLACSVTPSASSKLTAFLGLIKTYTNLGIENLVFPSAAQRITSRHA